MKFFAIIVSILGFVYSTKGSVISGIDEDLKVIEYINKLNTTWKAGKNFEGFSHEYIKGLLGSVIEEDITYNLPLVIHKDANIEIPVTFDARTKWPGCPTIGEIRDQGSCGSCWAFGAVEAMSDRICIASKGKQIVELSAQHLLSCCTTCGNGCKGGSPGAAWNYWVSHGVVTGGLYESKKGCQPYEIASCEHHTTGHLKACSEVLEATPKCVNECKVGYNVNYISDKHFGVNAYSIALNVEEIQTEILTHGPIEASFMVYDDFIHYKTGVYQRVSTKYLGGHAVKVLGWGVENQVPYWLVANSWNADWGDHGYFKIRRGFNECGIEGHTVAGLPKL